MIDCEFLLDKGILVLRAQGPLDAQDFTVLTRQIKAYLVHHEELPGILLRAKSFPGWKDLDALFAHLKFLREFINRIGKVAVVANGALADVMPGIANHFVQAQVRHFDFNLEDEALDWIAQTEKAQANPVV